MSNTVRTPRWVWLLIAAMALSDLGVHLWVTFAPPRGFVATGLHTFDDIVYRVAMDMFDSGFNNPFAVNGAPLGTHAAAYFAVPWYWLYGAAGFLATRLQMPHFLMLAVLNGLGLAFYLYAGWRFLAAIAPDRVRLAFALWTLGGGLGGAIYLWAMHSGWLYAPEAEAVLPRLLMYDVIEGANLLPILNGQRFYYTFPLALGLVGFARIVHRRSLVLTAPLLFAACFLNLRVAPPLLVGILVYLACMRDIPVRRWAAIGAACIAATAIGVAASMLAMSLSPAFTQNAVAKVSAAAWLTPLLVAGFFYMVPAIAEIRRLSTALGPIPRMLLCSVNGYLLAFVALYIAHHLWYGNALGTGEAAAGIAASDLALLGGAAGIAWAWRRAPRRRIADKGAWVALWAVALLALSVSAFGQGAYLTLVPQRFMVLLGLPLSLLTAECLTRWPRAGRVYAAVFLLVGGLTVLVGALMVQGPLAHTPGRGALAGHHAEYMRDSETVLLQALAPGTVLAPPSEGPHFGDVLALRPETRSVTGVGATDFADLARRNTAYRGAYGFFSPDAANRADVLETFDVDFVYCPSTRPVTDVTLRALREWERLQLVAATDGGAVFRVRKGRALP